MQLFVQTVHCTSRLHCETCRNKDGGGKRWRESISKSFELPNNDVDFNCPHGVSWGYKKSPEQTQPSQPISQPDLSRILRAQEAALRSIEVTRTAIGSPGYRSMSQPSQGQQQHRPEEKVTQNSPSPKSTPAIPAEPVKVEGQVRNTNSRGGCGCGRKK